jgi:hypothetical protein
MNIRPVLRLSQRQLEQLISYCAEYRAYLWQQMTPTPLRNQLVRQTQALQGRLEKAHEQRQAEVVVLAITGVEQGLVTQLFSGVMQCYAAAPSCEQRIRQLAELTTFRALVERTLRQAS